MVLNTAVVGAGVVSQTHLSGIEQCPRTSLEAVCDLDEDRADEVARERGIEAWYDAEELLADRDLDWLHICTSVQSHRPLAETALEAGVPVLIEKPVTETVDELAAIRETADAEDVPFSEVHNRLYDPAMRSARDAVADGEIGDIRGVTCVYTGISPPDVPERGEWAFDLPGGEFEEGLPHPLYLTMVCGTVPNDRSSVRASTTLLDEYEDGFAYDCAQLQYVAENGALCNCTMLSSGIPQQTLQIHGEEATLTVDLLSQTVVRLPRDYANGAIGRVRNNVDRALARVTGTAENARLVFDAKRDDSWESQKRINSHYSLFDEHARRLQAGEDFAANQERSRWTIAMLEELRAAATGERPDGEVATAAADD